MLIAISLSVIALSPIQLEHWLDPEAYLLGLEQLGWWGPIALMSFMAVAVVISPIPSAPIAVAAGSAYGHFWGTIYALVGAEFGALIAFEIARRLGGAKVSRWIGTRAMPPELSGQLGLSALVFTARLLPAISFDVVSYAAGLTPLRRRWFALATALGMIPATFLLSHAGAGLRSAQGGTVDVVLSLSGLVLLGALGAFLGYWRRNRGHAVAEVEGRQTTSRLLKIPQETLDATQAEAGHHTRRTDTQREGA